MEISVIIPCYNAVETIGVQLDALAGQSWSGSWEVIVSDNRSTDGSMEVVKKYRERLPGLRIVDASQSQGQPYALNVGVRAAKGDSLLFCDADDMVGSEWLSAMSGALSRHDFIACRTDTDRLNIGKPMDDGKGNPQKDSVQLIWYPPYLPHAGSGTLGVKSVLHKAVGGFDESLPYLFDTDYCFKIQMISGAKLHFVPEAVMHIRNRDSFGGTYRQSRNYAEYNVALFSRYRKSAKEEPNLWRKYLWNWKQLLRRVPAIRSKEKSYKFAWDLGRQLGRLKGSFKYRVPPV